jgi:LysM repeat protein
MFPRLLLLVLCAAALWGGFAHASGASGQTGGTYVVKQGDTLWSIADRLYGGDPRKGVWDLEQKNGLGPSPTVVPGQRLALPW